MEPDENVPYLKADALIQTHRKMGPVDSQFENLHLLSKSELQRQYDEAIHLLLRRLHQLLCLLPHLDSPSFLQDWLREHHQLPRREVHLGPYVEQQPMYMDPPETQELYLAATQEQLDARNRQHLRIAELQTLPEDVMHLLRSERLTYQGRPLLDSDVLETHLK